MESIKYYIATKQDKVGTVFTVARYIDNEFKNVYINKVSTNGIDGIKDIVKWIVDKESNSDIHMMSFKFKNVDIAVQIGNMLDKEDYYKNKSKETSTTYFSSPAVFSNDLHKMHKAESSLCSYLILREHYQMKGKI